jgi:outer membrane lipoprotein-sorting protein
MDPNETKLAELFRRAACDDHPRGEHRAALRNEVLVAFNEAQSRAARHGRVLSFVPDHVNWRTIMSHPASRLSAVAALVIALLSAVWFFAGGPTTTALAAFAEPLLNAKTAKFKLTARADGKVVTVGNLLVSGPRMRTEMEQPGQDRKQIDIVDETSDRSLTLIPSEKQAEITRYKNRPESAKTGGFLQEIRKMLLESETDGKSTRESLGEREVDGHKLVGYRIANPAMTLEIWGDPATGLPHSIIQSMSAYPSITSTMSDFAFDEPFDESLLSLIPPAGYQVSERELEMSLPTEVDLIAALRAAAEINGNVFPDALNMKVGHGLVKAFRDDNDGRLPADDLDKECQELNTKIARGFGFTWKFPDDKQHYAGKSVKLGTPNTVLFWYQPEGKDTYRVIYADLSTVDSNAKPSTK